MKKVVIYARYSSAGQNEQSIEGQLKDCYAFAARNDMTVIHEYIDRALTGTTDKRPEFLQMIEDSKKRRFDYVIVYQLDRFARNRYDSATYKARLKKNGVRVLSARENITDDASGVLIEGVLESMAEYFSAELSQKVKRGIAISAAKLQYTGGGVPFGYRIDEDKRFQINEETAPFVVKIFEMYLAGKTGVEIFKFLNDRHIKTSMGGKWNKSSLQRILINRRYLGYYINGDSETKGGIPQIVDEELFEQVQQQMERNKRAPSARKAEDAYILTTKLHCGLDDALMTGISGTSHTGAKHFYYKCFGVKNGCKKKNVQKDFIEDLVIADTLTI
ncbi:MAG: recombinase family protein, partial [Firmicutes bacterium]|nr:recombinase family protein [Bacillota bacterium]